MIAGGDQGSPLTIVQDQVIKGTYPKGKLCFPVTGNSSVNCSTISSIFLGTAFCWAYKNSPLHTRILDMQAQFLGKKQASLGTRCSQRSARRFPCHIG